MALHTLQVIIEMKQARSILAAVPRVNTLKNNETKVGICGVIYLSLGILQSACDHYSLVL